MKRESMFELFFGAFLGCMIAGPIGYFWGNEGFHQANFDVQRAQTERDHAISRAKQAEHEYDLLFEGMQKTHDNIYNNALKQFENLGGDL